MTWSDLRGSALLCLLAFALLCVQSAWPVLRPHPAVPLLTLPIVVVLGASRSVTIGRGAATSFALGYVMDLFTANALGPFTFAFVFGYLCAKLLASRLSFRGVAFEVAASFAVCLFVELVVFAVRSAFSPVGFASNRGYLGTLFLSALATALVAPLVIAVARRADRNVAHLPSRLAP